jgi:hypothetical protein
MERFIMDDFHVQIPLETLTEKLHLTEEEDIEMMAEKLEEALRIAKPKAVYKICEVTEIDGDQVTIEDAVFQSKVMASKLKGVHNVFAFVATCGTEVDDWSRQEEDYIVNLWLDMLKEMILVEARKQFRERLSDRYGIKKFAVMNPGSGNADTWPIGQQSQLFSLIGDVKELTGVELTGGALMYPTKSVSGVMFPSEEDFVSCSICKRKNCQNRKKPYMGE